VKNFACCHIESCSPTSHPLIGLTAGHVVISESGASGRGGVAGSPSDGDGEPQRAARQVALWALPILSGGKHFSSGKHRFSLTARCSPGFGDGGGCIQVA
jgi:hypothetical protein